MILYPCVSGCLYVLSILFENLFLKKVTWGWGWCYFLPDGIFKIVPARCLQKLVSEIALESILGLMFSGPPDCCQAAGCARAHCVFTLHSLLLESSHPGSWRKAELLSRDSPLLGRHWLLFSRSGEALSPAAEPLPPPGRCPQSKGGSWFSAYALAFCPVLGPGVPMACYPFDNTNDILKIFFRLCKQM